MLARTGNRANAGRYPRPVQATESPISICRSASDRTHRAWFPWWQPFLKMGSILVEPGDRDPWAAPHSAARAPERWRLAAVKSAQQQVPASQSREVQMPLRRREAQWAAAQTDPRHVVPAARKVAASGGTWSSRQAAHPAGGSPMPDERHRAIACRTRQVRGGHFARQGPAHSWRPAWVSLAVAVRLCGPAPSAQRRSAGLWSQAPQQPTAIFQPPARP